ncbi:MAG: peptidoglycan DD-metalloendopeptidase family protein [Porticoccaceae bacterium]|jgi:lipoprotein NlpD
MLRLTLPLLILLVSFLSQGCTPYNAPIVDLDQPPSRIIKTHLVEEGETLYSIAWRYDFNASELARINGLSKPYGVRKGQVLNLDRNVKPKISTTSAVSKVKKVASKVIDRTVTPVKKPTVNQSVTKLSGKKLHWKKPIKGKIIKSYNPNNLQKGIVIQANSGAPVKPAAHGVVVYAGDGLRDYGKLVIIKHSDYLLSAYGHNQKLLVSEGQVVDGSKIISKLGTSGRLYFEIRKDGKPVNPVAYIK